MSYQLPDLLTFLTSLPPSPSLSGDLHINPSYTPSPLPPLPLPPSHPPKIKIKKLQKTPKELITEYNPGLLASIFLPFTKSIILRAGGGYENAKVVRVFGEWVGVCALVGEETVRPGRVVGIADDGGGWVRECLEEIANRLPSTLTDNLNTTITSIIHASTHPPPKPPHPQFTLTHYLNWRIDLSGHRVLSKLLFSPSHRHQEQYESAIELTLQIVVCVTDLFAYNIHQAWNDRNHLNLISFLLQGGGGSGSGSETLALQGAITIAGDMIRQRMIQLQTELYHTGNPQEGRTVANILTSFFTTTDNDDTKSETRNDDEEIRQTIWNWVTGIIHWAYEVDYFSPNLEEDEDDDGKHKKKKKKGGEIRDYGWVFLIPKEVQ